MTTLGGPEKGPSPNFAECAQFSRKGRMTKGDFLWLENAERLPQSRTTRLKMLGRAEAWWSATHQVSALRGHLLAALVDLRDFGTRVLLVCLKRCQSLRALTEHCFIHHRASTIKLIPPCAQLSSSLQIEGLPPARDF